MGIDKEKFVKACCLQKSGDPMLEELRSLPCSEHDDQQDAKALVPPMAGILGASAVILNPKLKEAHVEIPREPDVFRPTKAMLDILSERIDSDLNKRLTEFGKKNGFPVVFVFYQTVKDENGISKATCDIKMYKKSEMREAADFARRNGGEFGIFDPPKSKEVERMTNERDYWKSRCLHEEDDGDTLGIFRHWDD